MGGTWGHGYMGSWDHFLISLISSSSLLHRLHYFIVFITSLSSLLHRLHYSIVFITSSSSLIYCFPINLTFLLTFYTNFLDFLHLLFTFLTLTFDTNFLH